MKYYKQTNRMKKTEKMAKRTGGSGNEVETKRENRTEDYRKKMNKNTKYKQNALNKRGKS